MQGKIDEALIEHENIFDHQAERFSLAIAIEMVPPHKLQTRIEGLLHAGQLIGCNDVRQHDDAAGIEFLGELISLGRQRHDFATCVRSHGYLFDVSHNLTTSQSSGNKNSARLSYSLSKS